MVDFSHIKALEVAGDRTAEMTLFQLEGEPVLVLAPATENNVPLFNAALRRQGQVASMARVGASNVNTIKEGRAEDRELYAKHVVRGWRNVVDTDGEAVPFSKENCLDFLRALPIRMFDDVREFARNPLNFVDELPDTEAVAGN